MINLTPKIIGAAGESIAKKRLIEIGFDLVEFGRESEKYKIPHDIKIPLFRNYWLGSSRANLGKMQRSWDNIWVSGEMPEWADIGDSDIVALAHVCQKVSTCKMFECNKNQAPCVSPGDLFSQDNLANIYPEGVISIKENGVYKKLSGMHFAYECSVNLSSILKNDFHDHVIIGSEFLKSNQIIDGYIERLWENELKNNPLPYSGRDFDKYPKGSPEESEMKAANLRHMKEREKIFPANHPGRYDFIGHKNSELFAVEVKTNNSKLNYWQSLRFKILNELGHNTAIVHVKADKQELSNFIKCGDIGGISVDIKYNPAVEVDYIGGQNWREVIDTPRFYHGVSTDKYISLFGK